MMTIIACNLIAECSCKIISNNGFLINNFQLIFQLIKEVIKKFIDVHLFLGINEDSPGVLESGTKWSGIMVQPLTVFQSGKN